MKVIAIHLFNFVVANTKNVNADQRPANSKNIGTKSTFDRNTGVNNPAKIEVLPIKKRHVIFNKNQAEALNPQRVLPEFTDAIGISDSKYSFDTVHIDDYKIELGTDLVYPRKTKRVEPLEQITRPKPLPNSAKETVSPFDSNNLLVSSAGKLAEVSVVAIYAISLLLL